jgi:hypothetical protein
MGELRRKDEELTTAELAARAQTQEWAAPAEFAAEDPGTPKPVRREGASGAVATMPQRDIPAGNSALFSTPDVGELRARWSTVQSGFVDEPRRTVEEADKLVAAVMARLAESFANERSSLEKQWDSGENVSTEDLRIALQRYRSFFDRLLNA